MSTAPSRRRGHHFSATTKLPVSCRRVLRAPPSAGQALKAGTAEPPCCACGAEDLGQHKLLRCATMAPRLAAEEQRLHLERIPTSTAASDLAEELTPPPSPRHRGVAHGSRDAPPQIEAPGRRSCKAAGEAAGPPAAEEPPCIRVHRELPLPP